MDDGDDYEEQKAQRVRESNIKDYNYNMEVRKRLAKEYRQRHKLPDDYNGFDDQSALNGGV